MIEHCKHIKHDNGIHEIILLTATNDVVDCYMAIVGPLFLNKPEDETLRYILNATQCKDLPPLRYFIQQSNDYKKQHPQIGPGRLAILYQHNGFWMIVSNVANMLNLVYKGDLILRMFEETEREQAIEWLLSDN
jgi:hypothetical protein